jgi:glycosyltransferase involved in cell wall biosynthesis
MISVIIPACNSGKTLTKALGSIYKNNFQDFEVIIVDDGSIDNTKEVVKNFPITYIALERNRGSAFARNKGVSLAKGDIFLFIDADVEIKEDLLCYIDEQFKRFEWDAISGVFSKEPKIKNIFLLFQSTLSNHNFSKTDFTFSGHLAAIRKTVFNRLNGFDERIKGATVEDFELSQRLIASGYKCKTDIKMAAYHNNNFTLRSLLRRMFKFGLFKTPLILEYNKNPEIRKQKKRYLVNNEYILSYFLILLILPAIVFTFYPRFNIFIFLIWLTSYILVKRDYLLSLGEKRLLMFLLLIITDTVVLAGCLIGAFGYYYDRVFKKNYTQT